VLTPLSAPVASNGNCSTEPEVRVAAAHDL
jgi:hypothetical protein